MERVARAETGVISRAICQVPHKDPFDRLLVVPAIVEDMAIMTIDGRIAELGARVVW